MSGVIDFLERMGADAQLRHASCDDIELALVQAQIDSAIGAAIIAKSTSELYALLDLQPMFHTQQNPGEEEEEEKEGDEEQDAPAPSPDSRALTESAPAVRTLTAPA